MRAELGRRPVLWGAFGALFVLMCVLAFLGMRLEGALAAVGSFAAYACIWAQQAEESRVPDHGSRDG